MEVANPGNSPADIKCKEGVMLYHAKKYSQAAEKYKEVLALDQGHVGCLNAFALLLSQTGNHQGCCEMYQRALQLSPSSTDTLFNYAAYKQLMVGDLVTSEKMYMKALSIEPKQTNCLFNLASLYNDKGNYDACLETYKRILRIKPDHVDSMCNSGQLLQSVFNVSEHCSIAREEYTFRGEWFAVGLRHCRGKLHVATRSAKLPRHSIDLAPISQAWITDHMANLQDLITAEAMYKKALEMQPDHDTCLYNYGLLFLHSDRPKEVRNQNTMPT
jgi:tetratricopeptide (TPR) repeat protein